MGHKELSDYIRRTGARARLVPVDVQTPTVEAAARAVGTSPQNIIKSLIFIAAGEPILVIAGGTRRVEIEILAREIRVDRDSIRLAEPQEVLDATGFSVGAVPPFGHIKRLSAYMDAGLLETELVYAGGGASDHLLQTSPSEILRLSGALVIQLQKQT